MVLIAETISRIRAPCTARCPALISFNWRMRHVLQRPLPSMDRCMARGVSANAGIGRDVVPGSSRSRFGDAASGAGAFSI